MIKEYSTGDNDSLEDLLITFMRLKNLDGKFIDKDDAIKTVIEALSMTPKFEGDLSNEAFIMSESTTKMLVEEPVAKVVHWFNPLNDRYIETLIPWHFLPIDTLLYAYPPKWQDVTDEEIDRLVLNINPMFDHGIIYGIKSAERILKDKNYG